MNEKENVCITKQGNTLVLRINRPEINCKINRATGKQIIDAISDANSDPDISCIVLTGTGEYFCGGGEVDNHPYGTLNDYVRYSEAFCNVHYAIYDSFKPVIAAVQGKAVAGGFSLVDACDLAVCSEDSVFALPEIKHSLFPMMALATTGKSMPKKRLLKLCYLAETLSAEDAKELGIVNEVVPARDVLNRALEISEEIAQYSSDAIAFGRRAYYAMNELSLKNALEYGRAAMFGTLYTDDAMKAGKAVKSGDMPNEYIKS